MVKIQRLFAKTNLKIPVCRPKTEYRSLHSSHALRCLAANFFAKGAVSNEACISGKALGCHESLKVLDANQRGDGYMEGNGYLVSWCVGHLVELSQPEAYDEKYAKWRYDDLPILPEHWQYQVSASTKKQFGRFSIKQMEKTRRKRRGSSRAFSRISGRWRHIRCRKKGSAAWK